MVSFVESLGGTVVSRDGAPAISVRVSVPNAAETALARQLTEFFAQAEVKRNLRDWREAPWRSNLPKCGYAKEIALLIEASALEFYTPTELFGFPALIEYLDSFGYEYQVAFCESSTRSG